MANTKANLGKAHRRQVKLGQLGAEIHALMRDTGASIAKDLVRITKITALRAEQQAVRDYLGPSNLKVQTGNLRRSIEGFVRQNGTQITVGLRNKMSYAAYLEYGTGPHVIKAVHGKALRFVIGGMVMFRKQVNHPGIKARQFLSKPLTKAGKLMVKDIRQAIKFAD